MPTFTELARLTAQPSRTPFAAPVLGVGGPPPAGRSLPFNMQTQLHENWCWAATATSVSQFYWPTSDWTQCKVACRTVGRTDCCNSSLPTACNQPARLDVALQQTQNLANMIGPVSFDQVRSEIDAGRVLGARTAWKGGGAHFVALYGYDVAAGQQWLLVDDPSSHKSRVGFAEFQSRYEGIGTWSHTYYTVGHAPTMPFQTRPLSDHVARHLQAIIPQLDPQSAPGTPPDAMRPSAAPASVPDITSERSLALAHPIYTVQLDELAAGRLNPARTGVRVFEMEADRPRAMFDLSSEHDSQLRQMSTTAPYLRQFPMAMSAALERIPPDKQSQYEARLFRVPSLNFEALWVHEVSDDKGDELVPLRSFHGFIANEPVPYDEAVSRLKDVAVNMAAAHDGETTGA